MLRALRILTLTENLGQPATRDNFVTCRSALPGYRSPP